MSVYSYVDAPNPNLTCCICRNTFVDPATTKCSHTFCYECILDALSHAPQCPIDRSPLTAAELGPADSIVRALVDELLVECVHREQGCDHTCQRQLLSAHLRKVCAYSEVLCQEEGCMERVFRKDIGTHMEAEHGKALDVPSCVNAEGEDTEVPSTTTSSQSCSESRNGCPFTTTEADGLSAHMATCAYQGIKEFFGVSAARHATLLEQNVLLRHRVSALETSVQILRREMETVRRALGPWVGAETRQSIPDGPSAVTLGESTSSAANTGDVEAFEEDAAGYRAAIGHGFPPIRGPHLTAPPSRPMYTPSNIVAVPHLSSVVAPLDLGTTVEGTLGGLRESVLALAAGVDSLGRRSEIALTNESFRFGEEIMSLRASINGLRMQVHTMMMERNAQVTGLGEEGMRPFMSITKL